MAHFELRSDATSTSGLAVRDVLLSCLPHADQLPDDKVYHFFGGIENLRRGSAGYFSSCSFLTCGLSLFLVRANAPQDPTGSCAQPIRCSRCRRVGLVKPRLCETLDGKEPPRPSKPALIRLTSAQINSSGSDRQHRSRQ